MEQDRGARAPESRSSATPGGELEQSSRLLEAATREWRALAESLHDLKKALEPDDFVAALTHLRIPDLGGLIHDWRRAQTSYEELLASNASASRAAAAGSSRETTSSCKETTLPPAASRPAPQTGTPQEGPGETPGIQEQLAELTALLRQHVALSGGAAAASRMEIPAQLTLNIAREVAGRVKDSVLETLRENGVDRGDRDRGSRGTDDGKQETRKVPLEDVAAMIDQLTKF